MRFLKFLLLSCCLVFVSCHGFYENNKTVPVTMDYATFELPENWVHYDQASMALSSGFLAEKLQQGVLFMAFDQQSFSWGNLEVTQETLFADFSQFEKNYQAAYKPEHGTWLDFSTQEISKVQVDNHEALWFSSYYLNQLPQIDGQGRQVALVSRPERLITLAVHWPEDGVTIFNCREPANNEQCVSILKKIKTVTPDVSNFIKPEPYQAADYQVGAPEGWYKVPANLAVGEFIKLPPLIRSVYNRGEELNILSPDSNFAITVNKVDVDLPLDDTAAIGQWGERIFNSASEKSAVVPTYKGPDFKGLVPVVIIDDVAFRPQNPQIKTRLAYILSNGFGIGVTCTYHENNAQAGLAYCNKVINSITFTRRPYRLVERLVRDKAYTVKVPRGWFALKNISDDDYSRLPEQVKRQYNTNNTTTLQLINRDIPQTSQIELVNISYANERLDFSSESFNKIENSVRDSFEKNYKNVRKVDGGARDINNRPAYTAKWNYQMANGLSLNSWQTFVACDRGTVIVTCIFQQSEEERVGNICEEISSSVQCN